MNEQMEKYVNEWIQWAITNKYLQDAETPIAPRTAVVNFFTYLEEEKQMFLKKDQLVQTIKQASTDDMLVTDKDREAGANGANYENLPGLAVWIKKLLLENKSTWNISLEGMKVLEAAANKDRGVALYLLNKVSPQLGEILSSKEISNVSGMVFDLVEKENKAVYEEWREKNEKTAKDIFKV